MTIRKKQIVAAEINLGLQFAVLTYGCGISDTSLEAISNYIIMCATTFQYQHSFHLLLSKYAFLKYQFRKIYKIFCKVISSE